MAEFSAATTGGRAVTAEGVVRGLFLTETGTEFTNLGAPGAHPDGERRGPAHPLSREQADVGAVSTESNTASHQILLRFMRHADHVIPAGITQSGAIKAGLDAVDSVLVDGVGRCSHGHQSVLLMV
jgi:hypothetical protein